MAGTMLFLGCCLPASATDQFCDRSVSKTTPSPEGRWIASVQEEVCTTDAGGAAAGITVVIGSAVDAGTTRRVFIMPVPRSREDWPRVRWSGPNALEIRVPNLSEPSPPEPQWNDIRVTLAYCGDDPVARQALADYRAAVKQWQEYVSAWVARRKQDEASAGPRPPRPEEPRLPPGRCTD
jgi:hypothetical protein